MHVPGEVVKFASHYQPENCYFPIEMHNKMAFFKWFHVPMVPKWPDLSGPFVLLL